MMGVQNAGQQRFGGAGFTGNNPPNQQQQFDSGEPEAKRRKAEGRDDTMQGCEGVSTIMMIEVCIWESRNSFDDYGSVLWYQGL